MKNKVVKIVVAVIVVALSTICLFGCKQESEARGELKVAYDVNLAVDVEQSKVYLKQKIFIENHYDSEITSLKAYLYPNAYSVPANDAKGREKQDLVTIGNVNCNGKNVSYSLEGILMTVNLNQSLTKGGQLELNVGATMSVPNNKLRYGQDEGIMNLAECYLKLAYYDGSDFVTVDYIELGDPFLSGLADYKVKVEVPKGWDVAHSGEEVCREEGETLKIQAELKGARDFAIAVGDFNVYQAEVDGIKIKHYTRSDEDYTSLIGRYLTEFISKIGDFPYKTLTVAELPFEYGGMEYCSYVVVNEKAQNKEEIIVHEMLHQYFACAVGSNGFTESYLDESLVSFLTIYYMDIVKGGGYYHDEVKRAEKYYDTFLTASRAVYGEKYNPIMAKNLDEYKSLYEYDALVYKYGVMAYSGLLDILGERKFNKAIKDYYDNNKGDIATTSNLIDSFEKVGGSGVRGVIEAYLYGKTTFGVRLVGV